MMAGSLNRVTLIGRLGQDPETRSFADGNMMATLSVATSERWTDRASGEKREKTEWHRVVVKRDATARFCADYLRKGALIAVTGKLETRKWQDQAGADRYTTEIVVNGYAAEIVPLDSSGRAGEADGPAPRRGADAPTDGLGDDIPF